MKQNLLSLALLALSFTTFAQQAPLQPFIDKYKEDKAFSYTFLSKDLFDVAVKSEVDNDSWSKLHNVVRNIGSLTVLVADSITTAPALYKEAMSIVTTESFDELLAVQDGKDRVKILAKEDGSIVTDLVVVVGTAEEFVLVCFSGNLELSNLSSLAALLDAGSAGELAKTTQAVSAEFSISPNPSVGEFTLFYPATDDQPQQMSVLDQTGRPISTVNLSGESSQSVALRDLPAGLYWIQLKTKQGKVGVKSVQIAR